MQLWGEMSEDWLGVPLTSEGRTVGALVVQSYTKEFSYTEQDKQLLAYVGQHVGAALSRARAIEETRQRNAEPALINSVQESIAGELDEQAIYDLVGDKIHKVFDAQVVDIAVNDEDAGLLRFMYQIERGAHYPNVTLPVVGFRRHVIETREPLAILENMEAALLEHDNPEVVVGERSQGSAIFQPLVVGGKSERRHLDPEPRPRARVQPLRPAAALDDRRQPRPGARERAPLRGRGRRSSTSSRSSRSARCRSSSWTPTSG